MPKQKTTYTLLVVLFVTVLLIRLYFAFSQQFFSDDQAYFHLRQIETIRDTGLPLFNDPLSFGGRSYIFMPFFDYVLAFFSSVIPIFTMAKLLPNIFASSLVFVVYFIVNYMTKRSTVALFTAFISAFIPIYFVETLNSISTYAFTIPLSFFLFYLIMRLEKKNTITTYLFFFILYMISHASIFLFILTFFMYFLMVKTERLSTKKGEIELLFFSIISVMWFYFIIYKKAFLKHGYGLIWQNIPTTLLTQFFKQLTVIDAITLIGIIPLITGIWMIYYTIFYKKNRELYLLISFVMVITICMWFLLIELNQALMYLSVSLVIMSGNALALFIDYIESTKFNTYANYIYGILILAFIVSSIIPSFTLAKQEMDTATSPQVIQALSFIKETATHNSKVLSSINNGHTIAYFSQKKNVADDNFLLIEDSNEIAQDIDTIFSTQSRTIGVSLLNKYRVGYIIIDKKTKQRYQISELPMYDQECFERTSFEEVIVYKNICTVVKG